MNAVSPGVIIAPGYKNALKMTDEEIAGYAANTEQTTTAGRPGTLEEIANVVLFLASSESSHVSGEEIIVDGGLTQIGSRPGGVLVEDIAVTEPLPGR